MNKISYIMGGMVVLLLGIITVLVFSSYYDRLSPCEQYGWGHWATRGAESKCVDRAMSIAINSGGVYSAYHQRLAVIELEGGDEAITQEALTVGEISENTGAVGIDESYDAMMDETQVNDF